MDPDTPREIRDAIRTIPDYPKAGVMFRDITTLLGNARVFHKVVEELAQPWGNERVDHVAGIEARGFIFAPALAYRLGAGFVPVRKPNKLPWKTTSVTYQLEYGTDTLEIHQDAVTPGQHVLLCDDLLATGGTAAASIDLVRKLDGEVVGAAFAVELKFLNGRSKLPGIDVFSMLKYDK